MILAVEGVEVHYSIEGEGPPLLDRLKIRQLLILAFSHGTMAATRLALAALAPLSEPWRWSASSRG